MGKCVRTELVVRFEKLVFTPIRLHDEVLLGVELLDESGDDTADGDRDSTDDGDVKGAGDYFRLLVARLVSILKRY